MIFLITKAEVILPLIKPISEKKSLYTDTSNRKDPTSIDKKISDRSEVIEMPKVKYITSESKYITSTHSRSRTQFI